MGKPKSVKLAHAKGVRKKSSARGQAYGSRRGIPDKQVHRTEVRYADPRVRTSLEEARAEQEALERQIAKEAERPALGATEGALYAAQTQADRERAEREAAEAEARRRERLEKSIREHRFEPWEGDARPGWTIGQARQMLRNGYAVSHVMTMTGVGYRWLSDIPLDAENRGCPE